MIHIEFLRRSGLWWAYVVNDYGAVTNVARGVTQGMARWRLFHQFNRADIVQALIDGATDE